MNSNHSNTANDTFETRLSEGLDHLASTTPTSDPGDFDPNRWATPTYETARQHTGLYLAAAAAAVAVTVAGLVAVSGRTDNEPALTDQPLSPPSSELPAPEIATDPSEIKPTASTILEPVPSAPTCGTDLPVTIDIPSAPDGPVPGTATFAPAVEGQFAQHWDLPAGTIEMRWPADEREIYDLERLRGNQSVFDMHLGVSTPDDGTQAIVTVSNIDPSLLSGDSSTLTMTATPAVATLQSPCDLLQVRYIDSDGNQATRAYDVTDFNGETGPNGEPGDSFGKDLNPLITSSSDATNAPDPTTTANCAGNDIDNTTAGPLASTPAEALAAYLESDGAAAGFITNGYQEFEIDATEYQYAIIYDDGTLITLFTVNRTGQDWAVSHVTSVGC